MRRINLTGKPGETYDLNKISSEDTRTNREEKLVVQVWEWNPKGIKGKEGSKFSNPPETEIGQIWLSKRVGL